MRKVFLFVMCLICIGFVVGQNSVSDSIILYTPGGILDKVFDNTGGIYTLEDIRIKDNHVKYSPPTSNDNQALLTPPLSTCQSGYFDLYFDDFSGMEIENDATHMARRNVICRAFKDVSDLIISPLTNTGNTNKVNILIRNFAQMNGSNNGSGISRSFYHAYANNFPGFGGIVDNEVWKTINSGVNSFSDITPQMNISMGGSANFYHGLIAFNFETVNWNLDLATNNFDWFLYDLYSTALHEIIHSLGFYSHIKSDGTTSFSYMPYYTRYDQHLMNNTENEHLIVNTGNCSSMFNYVYNPSSNMLPTTVLTPGCTSNPPPNNTNCSDALKYVGTYTTPVYTPSCFENGSSFSHFEDQCVANSPGNDEYYCMSNVGYNDVHFDNTNQVYYKRLLKQEERGVLCDIGYNTNSTFGDATNFNNIDYGSACIKSTLVGFNDGWTNGAYTYNTFTNTPYLISDFLDNDVLITNNGSTISYEYCIEDLTSSSIITYDNSTSFTFQSDMVGLHLLRYVPISSDGTIGNITYIYIFVERDCQFSPSCNMVSNDGFETNDQNCGYIENTRTDGAGSILDCWNPVIYTPDLFVRNCVTDFGSNGTYSVPVNNFGNVDSWDGSPNNAFIGLVSYTQNVFEGIANHLSSTITPGQLYTIKFKARQSIHFDNPQTSTGTIAIAGSENLFSTIMVPLTAIPTEMTVLREIDIVSPDWLPYEETFTYNGLLNLDYLNLINSTNIDNQNEPNRQLSFVLIDDVELFPFNPMVVSVSISASSTCSSQSIIFTATGTNGGANPSYQWVLNGANIVGATSPTYTATVADGDIVTCILTNNDACVSNGTATSNTISISGSAGPTVNIDVPDNSICEGESTTLTASGADSYVWSTGATTASITVTTTGTYSVTGTQAGGCSSTESISITVNPLPVITFSPENPSICAQSSTSIEALGNTAGTNFTWTGFDANTNPITVNPTTTTSYTVTGTDPNGCVNTADVSLTVNPLPNVTIEASSTNICIGEPVTVTASGNATSYVWDNGYGNGTSIAVNLNSTNTFTVTGYLGTCEAEASVVVEVQNCACTAGIDEITLPATISTTTNYTNQLILVDQNVTISANTTFTNCEIKIAPNVSITIPKRKTSFIGCHLYGCSDMWKGIIVTLEGKVEFLPIFASNGVTVTKTTLVEDAKIAVQILEGYSNYNPSQLVIKANKTTFNKNHVNIEINKFNSNNISDEPSVFFDISDNVFTCRNLNFTPGTFVWPYSHQVRGNSGTTDALSPQYINSNTYGAIGSATLKFPHIGQITDKGIVLNEVGLLLGSFPNYSQTSIIIGSANPRNFNLFDNMNTGIYCNNSNLICKANVFQNIFAVKGFNKAAIFMESTTGSMLTNRRNSLQILSGIANSPLNRFYNCAYAVWGRSLWSVKIDNIWVRNDFTNATPRNGIFINTAFYRQIDINNSSFYNTHNAITINHIDTDDYIDYVSVFGTNEHTAQVNGSITIRKNRFEDNFTNVNIPFRQLRNAIIVNNVSLNQGYMIGGSNVISENKMTDVFNGIKVLGWKRKQISIVNNEVKLVQENGSSQQFGIANTENEGNSTSNPNKIENNIVDGYNADDNPSQVAIYSSRSNNQLITCNYVSNSFHGIKFDNWNNGTRFEKNEMTNHTYGYTLDWTGMIGTQGLNGTNTYNTDNYWGPNVNWPPPHYKTYTANGSFAQNSIIYARSTPEGYVPEGTSSTAGTQYSTSTGAILTAPVNNSLNCNPDYGNPNTGGNGNGNGTGVLSSGSTSISLLEQIALNELEYTHNPEQTQLINEHKLFQLLEQEPDLRGNSSILETFYQDNLTSNKGKVRKAENYLASGDVVLATNEVNNIVDNNEVDYSYKSYYDWYLNQTWDSLPNPSDSTYLFDLANSCPFTKGSVVYQARALYQSIYNYSEAFIDDCENKRGGGSHSISQTENNKEEQIANSTLTIYPNPTNGNIYFSKFGIDETPYLIKIVDVTGKLILEKELMLGVEVKSINIDVSSGVYKIEVMNKATNEKINHKIHIIR